MPSWLQTHCLLFKVIIGATTFSVTTFSTMLLCLVAWLLYSVEQFSVSYAESQNNKWHHTEYSYANIMMLTDIMLSGDLQNIVMVCRVSSGLVQLWWMLWRHIFPHFPAQVSISFHRDRSFKLLHLGPIGGGGGGGGRGKPLKVILFE